MFELLFLILFFGYFGLLMFISQRTRGKGNNESFFVGEHRSPWILVAIGMLGASLSGVSFISVPGMPMWQNMAYMQMVLGFVAGYVVIAYGLLPLYYRLKLISIYEYIRLRMGERSYKTGAVFFLISKLLGTSVKLYIVAFILQQFVFNSWGIPLWASTLILIVMIWAYSHRSGIRTIVWTDTLQTICFIGCALLIFFRLGSVMQMDFSEMVHTIKEAPQSRIFYWDDWRSPNHFLKLFFSGMFVTIVMTGLDQDMMQKNLSCKNYKEAKKNMLSYGVAFVPVNLLFLSLGVLLIAFVSTNGIDFPLKSDGLFPLVAGQYMGSVIALIFVLGIISAAFSSADSALTAMTTSFCVDILSINRLKKRQGEIVRKITHAVVCLLIVLCVSLMSELNSGSIIDTLYIIVSYSYGPLLGLFSFGLLTKRQALDRATPYVAVLAPLLCYAIGQLLWHNWHYQTGYEMLLLNGGMTFIGLFLFSKRGYSSEASKLSGKIE